MELASSRLLFNRIGEGVEIVSLLNLMVKGIRCDDKAIGYMA